MISRPSPDSVCQPANAQDKPATLLGAFREGYDPADPSTTGEAAKAIYSKMSFVGKQSLKSTITALLFNLDSPGGFWGEGVCVIMST